jgi:hypothetical protein
MLMHFPASSTLTIAAMIPLICWRIYARFKRLVGKQRFSYARPWISLSIFPAITVLLVIGTQAHPVRLAYLAAGIAVGVALGVFGLRRTKFEMIQKEFFYTPNAHVGIALSLLLFGRILYRAFQMANMPPEIPDGLGHFAGTPITLSIFGLLAGYYVSYAIGLLRWRSSAVTTHTALEAESAEA